MKGAIILPARFLPAVSRRPCHSARQQWDSPSLMLGQASATASFNAISAFTFKRKIAYIFPAFARLFFITWNSFQS